MRPFRPLLRRRLPTCRREPCRCMCGHRRTPRSGPPRGYRGGSTRYAPCRQFRRNRRPPPRPGRAGLCRRAATATRPAARAALLPRAARTLIIAGACTSTGLSNGASRTASARSSFPADSPRRRGVAAVQVGAWTRHPRADPPALSGSTVPAAWTEATPDPEVPRGPADPPPALRARRFDLIDSPPVSICPVEAAGRIADESRRFRDTWPTVLERGIARRSRASSG